MIRGHTAALVIKGEVIYVEPIFIRSQQNPVTQMKKVIVVFRGKARMGLNQRCLQQWPMASSNPSPPLRVFDLRVGGE